MKTVTDYYFYARFQRVLEYIDAHLDDDLCLEILSGIAAYSKYHFQRQFSALFGIGVYQYIQLCRLKRASYHLAFRDQNSVTDIALASSYEGPESFSRAFRKSVGQSPSAFRRQPQWRAWHAAYNQLSELKRQHMQSANHLEQVRIIHFEETKVAVLEHHGDPQLIGDSIRKFIAWRKQHQLSPKSSATFNILYNNPGEVAPADYQLDICVAFQGEVASNSIGMVQKVIPAGRCAVLRHIGSDDLLANAIEFLYAEWLPQSGEVPGDFPVFLQRVLFFPDVAESEATTDIFLPLQYSL